MASPEIETVGALADKVKLAVVVVLAVASIAAFYLSGTHGVVIQWLILSVGLIAAGALFLATEPGRLFVSFSHEATREVKKVVWPARKEALQMTAYVFGFVIVMALFLWFTDKTLEWVLYDLILGWRK